MPENKRFVLFSGDGPLNARDNVIQHIIAEIESSLGEDEPAFLNYAVAYLRCLIAVARDTGGAAWFEDEIGKWEKQALKTYDRMKNPPQEAAVDRPFLQSLFDELRELANE